jgi:hypothetical protein
MEQVSLDRVCPLCGSQVYLDIAGPSTHTDVLADLTRLQPGERRVLLVCCDCSRPQLISVKGAPVRRDDVNDYL